MRSPLYRSAVLYRLVMRLLYGHNLSQRFLPIAQLIEPGASVVDLCCGPADLRHYLKEKGVDYLGLDSSPSFSGQYVKPFDLFRERIPTTADYVVMQASLYQFYPHHQEAVLKMIEAARNKVLISEPVVNIASHSNPLVRRIAKNLTDPGHSQYRGYRFDEGSLDSFMSQFNPSSAKAICSGREKLFVIDGGAS